jgi:hypothetical protein
MAKLLGRHKAACLGCGFHAPHVKKNEGKRAYVHCPECGLTVAARNGNQEAHLLANMRPELHELPRRADDIEVPNVPHARPAAVPAAAQPAAAPAAAAPAPAPAVPARKRGALSTLLG